MMASSKNSTTSSCGSGCNTPSSSGSSVHSVTVFTDGKIPVPERRNHPIHEQTGTTDVLTFYPTMEEFSDFPAYIKKIETVGAHTKCGICKVIPPEGWTPRPNAKGDYSDVDEYVITNPVKEKTIGRSGVFVKSNSVYRRKLSVREFKKLATSKEYLNPQPHLMGSDLEHYFFRNILLREPIYGADTEGSLYESQVKEFNMSELGTVLDEIKVDGKTIPGVNTVYLYFGMYKAMFPWHCEDMDLYSINYLHYGEPKYWFGISSESSDRFERLMTQQAPGHNVNCKAFLRHKSYICSPSILRTHNVPYGTMVQNPNEFIITFPKGYHMGWNLGYNCAESTNFASDRWIDFGKNAILCKCRPDCVEIDMSPFMKKYRPDEYEKWHSYWYQPKPAANALQLKKATKGKRGCSNGDDMLAPTSKKPRTSAGSAESSASLPGEAQTMCSQEAQSFTITAPFLKRQTKYIEEDMSSNSINLFAEKEANRKDALRWPHCSVCNYFQPHYMQKTVTKVPKRSSRLVYDLCFAKDVSRGSLTEESDDALVTCSNCCVTVHPSCYGGEKIKDPWKCLRCRGRSDVVIRAVSCCLCERRGGALIPCQVGSDPAAFAHVICAIFNRRTSFNRTSGPNSCYTHPLPKQAPSTSVLSRLPAQYVILMGDDHENSKYECEVCGTSREGLVRCATCPEESIDPVLAHATCGRRAGFLFEQRHYPQCAAMICNRHTYEDSDAEQDDADLPPISPLSEVVVWLDGGHRVLPGRVERVDINRYLVVEFLDGTLSRNTLISDVTRCSCHPLCQGGQHQLGARLSVRWNDDMDYEGFFRCVVSVREFTVSLLGGRETVTVDRGQLYAPHEQLPADVRRKLEQALAACQKQSS